MKTKPFRALQFWQKACAILWAAFLLCLGIVCGTVYFLGKAQGYATEVNAHLSAQEAMILQLAKDVSALQSRSSNALPALWRVYEEQYQKQNIALEIYENGEKAYSSLAKNAEPPVEDRQELSVQPGQRTRLVYKTPAGRRLFIAAALPESLGKICVVYSADTEPFYRQWEQIMRMMLLAGSAAAILYAVVLYALLRWMYQPLARVTAAARALENGDRAARAAVKRNDEFGELASALNGMADTVQNQMEQLQSAAGRNCRSIWIL